MKSTVIKSVSQLTLDFEPGLVERYGSLRECIASGVYQRGLGSVAIDLDEAPGNLSVKLSANDVRHFHIDNLERYLEKTGDLTPIYYLAEKFLSDEGAKQKAASAELMRKMSEITELMKRAGVTA